MRNVPAEAQPETVICERAERLLRVRRIMVNYAEICHDESRGVTGADAGLMVTLTAEAERAGKVAEKAGQIVRTCNGCDGNGIRLQGVTRCPQETAISANEWWWGTLRVRPSA